MELLIPFNHYRKYFPLKEKDVIKLGIDICTALEACQTRRPPILHRDIKASNIMVDWRGNFKLGDFGIARAMEGTKSAHTKAGTSDYMAPEILNGASYFVTADIYSLGVLLYRFLNNNRSLFLPADRPLTEDLILNALDARLSGKEVPPPASGSPELQQVILKALSYDPSGRYQTATEFRWALERCQKLLEEEETDTDPNRSPKADSEKTPDPTDFDKTELAVPSKDYMVNTGASEETQPDEFEVEPYEFETQPDDLRYIEIDTGKANTEKTNTEKTNTRKNADSKTGGNIEAATILSKLALRKSPDSKNTHKISAGKSSDIRTIFLTVLLIAVGLIIGLKYWQRQSYQYVYDSEADWETEWYDDTEYSEEEAYSLDDSIYYWGYYTIQLDNTIIDTMSDYTDWDENLDQVTVEPYSEYEIFDWCTDGLVVYNDSDITQTANTCLIKDISINANATMAFDYMGINESSTLDDCISILGATCTSWIDENELQYYEWNDGNVIVDIVFTCGTMVGLELYKPDTEPFYAFNQFWGGFSDSDIFEYVDYQGIQMYIGSDLADYVNELTFDTDPEDCVLESQESYTFYFTNTGDENTSYITATNFSNRALPAKKCILTDIYLSIEDGDSFCYENLKESAVPAEFEDELGTEINYYTTDTGCFYDWGDLYYVAEAEFDLNQTKLTSFRLHNEGNGGAAYYLSY